jgi:hypothetical protein
MERLIESLLAKQLARVFEMAGGKDTDKNQKGAFP